MGDIVLILDVLIFIVGAGICMFATASAAVIWIEMKHHKIENFSGITVVMVLTILGLTLLGFGLYQLGS